MSFPNPAMLPFFAAGGAISGSSFGLFYTILMQVGYNYFGKRVLKGLNEGGDLKQLLWQVQQEIQPFSDSMLDMALASMPDVAQKTAQALADAAEKLGAAGIEELKRSWLLPHGAEADKLSAMFKGTPQTNIPDWLKAGAIHPLDTGQKTSSIISREVARGAIDIPKGYTLWNGKLVKISRLQSLIETQKKATIRADARSGVAQLRLGFTRKRKAGQSQIMERKKLIRDILKFTKASRADKSRSLALALKDRKQKLVNLLARYQF